MPRPISVRRRQFCDPAAQSIHSIVDVVPNHVPFVVVAAVPRRLASPAIDDPLAIGGKLLSLTSRQSCPDAARFPDIAASTIGGALVQIFDNEPFKLGAQRHQLGVGIGLYGFRGGDGGRGRQRDAGAIAPVSRSRRLVVKVESPACDMSKPHVAG